jgi:hypothetical protein
VDKRTGTLEIVGRESRLNGVLLAKCDSQDDPIQEATGFLKDKGLQSGDSIWVTGQDGHVGNTHVFCMTDAGKSAPLAMMAETAAVAKVAAKPKTRAAKAGKKKETKPKVKKKAKRAAKGRRKKP